MDNLERYSLTDCQSDLDLDWGLALPLMLVVYPEENFVGHAAGANEKDGQFSPARIH